MEGGLEQILTLIGSTSPVVALLAWHIWNQGKQFEKFAASQEKTTEALHDVDKRLAVIENFVESRKSA